MRAAGTTTYALRDDGTSVHAEYTWFAGDKLKRIDSTFPGEEARVSFNYDGLGKRRNKYVNTTDLTWYRWAGWNVIADYTGDGSWTVGARTMSYTPGLAQAPGANPTTAAYQYYIADHLGSVRQITAQDKSVLAQYAYTPYGETDFAAGLAMTHGFTGHRWDAETGLYFAPFRYYAPQNARWMKRDPLGLVDGVNMYAYVGNRPASRIDSLGLSQMPPSQAQKAKEKKRKGEKCLNLVKERIKRLNELTGGVGGIEDCQFDAEIGVGGPPGTWGWSPRPGYIGIRLDACEAVWSGQNPYPADHPDVDDWFDYLLFHENAHARSNFSRPWYLVNPKFKEKEEKRADKVASSCLEFVR